MMIVSPLTKILQPFNIIEGAESLPKYKIAAFNYEYRAYEYYYYTGINARLSRLLIDIPDGIDRVKIVGVEGTIADTIKYDWWDTSNAVLLYNGLPISTVLKSGANARLVLLDFNLSDFKDLKGRKLLAQLDMSFKTDVSQYQEKEHTGAFRVEYYIGDNVVETQYIDFALYSPGALVNSVLGPDDSYVKITLDDQTISRIDFIQVNATYNQPLAGVLLYVVELDENKEVIRHTKSYCSNIKITPHKLTRTIYISTLPYTWPWHNVQPTFYISIYARYVSGLPTG
jgi:hypothetical protein